MYAKVSVLSAAHWVPIVNEQLGVQWLEWRSYVEVKAKTKHTESEATITSFSKHLE